MLLDIDKKRLIGKIKGLPQNIGFVPETKEDYLVDLALARTAAEIAVERHVGRIEEAFFPTGMIWVQYGKDCTGIKTVIGTGGVFAHGFKPEMILEATLFKDESPNVLKPKSPEFYIDRDYVLYGIGLLSDYYPTQALRIAKKSLHKLCT